MKLLFFAACLFATTPVAWLGNFGEAQQAAAASHKKILVNFSGSDWCGPCIRLRKEILESATFEAYAADSLILVRADFPRNKKNQLPPEQVKQNEALAAKYNPEGNFPYTLLIDENGKVLRSWDGYPNESPEAFLAQVKAACTQ